MSYPIYSPEVRRSQIQSICPDWAPLWGYNHDCDIVKFKKRWYAAWNGNEGSDKEAPNNIPLGTGQYNYICSSDDLLHWSRPIRAFGSAGAAINPHDDWHQWQPNFLNFRDETLFCFWCRDWEPVLSVTTDGETWTNIRYPGDPDARSFPTGHGLLTRNGVMLFPVSFFPFPPRNAAALRSEDGGKTWHYGENIVTPSLSELGLDLGPHYDGPDWLPLWEPHFFEHTDGRIGCLVRNCGHLMKITDPDTGEVTKCLPDYGADRMLLYAESRDAGQTWTQARPVPLETVSSRPWGTVEAQGRLLMVHNDWLHQVPTRVYDRHHLALFIAGTDNPDLLLPGPLIQPSNGLGHYPNAVIDGNELVVIYSYGTNPRRGVHLSRLPLPDYSEPFFLPREGRGVPVEIDPAHDTAYFPDATSTLGLVPTRQQLAADFLRLQFRAAVIHSVNYRTTPVLTVGAPRTGGCTIAARSADGCNQFFVQTPDGVEHPLGEAMPERFVEFEIQFHPEAIAIQIQGAVQTVEIQGVTLRKIAFGGLYEPPANHPSATSFQLDLNSVKLS